MSEKEKGAYRVTVTFPKKDAEWMQKQVDDGEYTSIAEVVRECVRTARTGGRREGVRIPTGPPFPGQEVVIPTEVAVETPEIISTIMEKIETGVRKQRTIKEKEAKEEEDVE